MIHTSYSPADTSLYGKEILRRLGERNIILLQGGLGTGKTTLTQAIAEELGVKESVISPTYVLLKEYQTKNENFVRLVHADLYRIEYNRHLDEIGLADYLYDEKTLVIVEWPERILGSWPHSAYNIRLDYGDKASIRTIDF